MENDDRCYYGCGAEIDTDNNGLIHWACGSSACDVCDEHEGCNQQSRRCSQHIRDQRDAALAEVEAWKETAAQFSRNADFYHGLVCGIGAQFGEAARTSDDGSIQDSVLALKVPELVMAALAEVKRLEGWRSEAMTVLGEWESVWRALGEPGELGKSRAVSALAQVRQWRTALKTIAYEDGMQARDMAEVAVATLTPPTDGETRRKGE